MARDLWAEFSPVQQDDPWAEFAPAQQDDPWAEFDAPQAPAPRAEMRAAPQSTFERYIEDPARRGIGRLKQAITTALRDEDEPERYAVSMARLQREQEAAGQSIEDQEAIARIAEAETWGDFLSSAWDRPDVIGQTIVESLATFAPALAGTVVAGLTAGPWGTAGAAGLGSGATEYMISLTDAIGEAGGDPSDPASWARAIQDKEVVDAARDKATKRGIAIGAFDALTAGLAGKLLAGARPGIVSPTARAGGEVGVQMAGGAGGETAAQLATLGPGQESLQIGEIGLEALAEGPTAAIEVPANIRSAREAAARRAAQAGPEETAPPRRRRTALELEQEALEAPAETPIARPITDQMELGVTATQPPKTKAPPAEAAAASVAVNQAPPAANESQGAQEIKQSAEGQAAAAAVNPEPIVPETPGDQAAAQANAEVTARLQTQIDQQAEAEPGVQAEQVGFGFQVNPEVQPTRELATAIETFNVPLQEYQQIAAQETKGRPRTATGDQLRTIDSMWTYMESQIDALANTGYDTKELVRALKRAAGIQSLKGKKRGERGDQPVTGRIKGGDIVPLGGRSKKTPKGGWGGVARDFYTDVYRALNNMLQTGPVRPPVGGIRTPAAAPTAPAPTPPQPTVTAPVEQAPGAVAPVPTPAAPVAEAASAPAPVTEPEVIPAPPAPGRPLTVEQQAALQAAEAAESGYTTTPEEEAAILAAREAEAAPRERPETVTGQQAAEQAVEAMARAKPVSEVAVSTKGKRRPQKAQTAIETAKKRAAAKKGKITLKKKEPAQRETPKPTAKAVPAKETKPSPKAAPETEAKKAEPAKKPVGEELKQARAEGYASVPAMKMAASYGIPTSEIKGTGRGGSIVKADVERARVRREMAQGEAELKAAMAPKPITRPAEPIEVTEETVEEIEAAPAPVDEVAGLEGYRNRFDIIDTRLDAVEAVEMLLEAEGTTTGGDIFRLLGGFLEAGDPYQDLIRALQNTAAADTPVSIISNEEMIATKGRPSSGNYSRRIEDGKLVREIVLNEEMFNTDNWGSKAVKTTLHELVHAATAESMRTDNAAANEMEKLRRRVRAALKDAGRTADLKAYGLTNVDEFVAEALSNVEFQRILATTPGTGGKSVWQNFLEAIANLLNIPIESNTALADVMALAPDLMQTTEEAQAAIEKRNRAPYIQQSEEEFTAEEIAEMMRGGPDLDRARITSNATNFGNRSVGSAAGQLYDKIKGSVDLREVGRVGQRIGLGFHTLDQLVRRFKGRFETPEGNALRDYDRIQRNKSTYARDEQQKAEKLNQRWRDLEKADPKQNDALNQLMHDATMIGVHPDLAFFNQANEHAWNKKELQQSHARLQERFNALSPRARGIYRQARQFYIDQRGAMRQASLQHVARSNKLDELLPQAEYDAILAAETPADIDAVDLTVLGEEADRVQEALEQVTRLTSVQGPYFPLRRFGKYVVEGTREGEMVGKFPTRKKAWEAARRLRADEPYSKIRTRKQADGTYTNEKVTRTVEMFDQISKANARAAEMNAEGYTGRSGGAISPSLKEEWNLPPGSQANVLLSQAKRKFADESPQSRALETAFIELLLENSVRKSELQRKKVKGASMEMRRAFAERAYAGSWGIADINTALDHDKAIKGMAKAARGDVAMGELVQELRTRDEKSLADRKIGIVEAAVSQYGFFNYLFSPSYTMVNLTQVPLVAGPYLQAKYGARSVAELGKVYKSIAGAAGKEWMRVRGGFKGAPENILDAVTNAPGTTVEEKRMIGDLAGLGIIDATFMQELYKTAAGRQETWIGQGWNRAMDVARASPQVAEVVNRVVVARAAFNLASQKGANYEQAREAASEAVLQTQFDYTDQNKPRYFKAFPGARAIMMFKMYAQGMYALLGSSAYNSIKGSTAEKKSEARKMFAGLIASHSLMAGVLGGVAAEPVRMLVWMFNQLGDDDDDDLDLDNAVTQALADLTGSPAVAEMIARGAPRGLGVDLSGRVGLDNLAFMGMRDARSAQEGYQNFLMAAGGPIVAAGGNIARGIDYISKEEYTRGFEAMLPKFFRDVMKASRYADEGMLDYNGNVIRGKQNFGAFEYGAQALGLQSAEAARTYEARTAMKGRETKLRDRRKKLMQMWRRKDPKERATFFRNTIVPFNRKNPEFNITVGKLLSSLKEQRRREMQTRTGAFTEKPSIRRIGEAYNL